MTPRVTVLTTLYNKGAFVEDAVRSVLAQTFSDFELLVVDDVSTDDGPDRVRRFDDPRVRIIVNPVNLGRAGAANQGFAAARGEYIAVLDADDVMMPDRLAVQVAFLDAHPEVVVCGGWAGTMGGAMPAIRPPADDEHARVLGFFGMPVLYPTAMFRATAVRDGGARCPDGWRHPGMDRLFMLDLGDRGRYANLQRPLITYRVGEQNMRHGRDPVADERVLCRAVFDRYGIAASEEELSLHLMLHQLFTEPPTAARVRALHRWMRGLVAWARRTDTFAPVLFEKELWRRWDWLFFKLAEQSTRAAAAHVFLGRDRRMARWRHLLSSALRRNKPSRPAPR
jgi:glycosyltransferase involved in cell wall biosynthesis